MRRAAALMMLLFLPAPAPAEWPARPTVRVLAALGGGATSQGSGTVVRKDEASFDVLTCRHVVRGARSFSVEAHDGAGYPARLLRVSDRHDLALLRVSASGADVAVARLAAAGADLSYEGLVKSGYPGRAGGRLVVARGPCADDMSGDGRGGASFMAGVTSAPGDSGGGLYRDADHALVGVVWGGTPGRLWAVPTPYVREFLGEDR